MNVGLLLPSSHAHPGLNLNFVDGMKTCIRLQELTQDIQFVSESIGYGGNEKEVYQKVEKLLVLDGVDILVAFIDLKVLPIVEPLLFTTGKLMIVINAGANYPENWTPRPNIVHLTLNHSFLCWLTGNLAGQHGANAMMSTTFYDGGYLHVAAMVKSFDRAGGNITFNYVNNQRYDDKFDINQVTDFLSGDRSTTSLLCAFDSLPASLFYNKLNDFDDAERLALFVSPMMLEEKAFENLNAGLQFSIAGYTPWRETLENPANTAFTGGFKQKTGRPATIFSLLGWEAGMIFGEVYRHFSNNYIDGAAIAGKLSEITLDSPRGELKLDLETNYFLAPVYKCQVEPGSAAVEVSCLREIESDWNSFIGVPHEGISSGWINTYLCY